jgi:hypothetical protein
MAVKLLTIVVAMLLVFYALPVTPSMPIPDHTARTLMQYQPVATSKHLTPAPGATTKQKMVVRHAVFSSNDIARDYLDPNAGNTANWRKPAKRALLRSPMT